MAQKIDVIGYESFIKCVEEINEDILINCFFYGSKGEDGKSWCPYCSEAEEYITSAIEKYGPENSIIIVVQVGTKESWLDPNNPFRTDRRINVQNIPTLMRWKEPQRLEGLYYCSNDDILELFFTDTLDEYFEQVKYNQPESGWENDGVQKIVVRGYDKLIEILPTINKDKQINILFIGKKLETGLSWCPDCARAEPYIQSALKLFGQEGSVLIINFVGDRTFWKNMKNPYRLDRDIHISVIPAIVRWKKPQRIDGYLCEEPEILEMFFTDPDDD